MWIMGGNMNDQSRGMAEIYAKTVGFIHIAMCVGSEELETNLVGNESH